MSTIKTEVVLEFDGRKLLSGSLDDFILDPNRGSQYFYEGNLYEVVGSIETIGDATSLMGTVLGELLNMLYPDATQAASLAGSMKRIHEGQADTADGATAIAPVSSIILTACSKERLLYVRLKCVRQSTQHSLITMMAAAAAAGADGALHS